MDLIKETKELPSLVNPKNFKITKEVPVVSFKQNSKNLNKILLTGFVIFFVFFLLNCKYGIFKPTQFEPEPYSMVYNLNV